MSKEDPNELYTDVLKIGEGYVQRTSPRALAWFLHGLREGPYKRRAAGEVYVATNIKTGNKVALKKMALNDESMEVSPYHHHHCLD